MTEDEEFGIRHTQSDPFRLSAVIDRSEQVIPWALSASSIRPTVPFTE